MEIEKIGKYQTSENQFPKCIHARTHTKEHVDITYDTYFNLGINILKELTIPR